MRKESRWLGDLEISTSAGSYRTFPGTSANELEYCATLLVFQVPRRWRYTFCLKGMTQRPLWVLLTMVDAKLRRGNSNIGYNVEYGSQLHESVVAFLEIVIVPQRETVSQSLPRTSQRQMSPASPSLSWRHYTSKGGKGIFAVWLARLRVDII